MVEGEMKEVSRATTYRCPQGGSRGYQADVRSCSMSWLKEKWYRREARVRPRGERRGIRAAVRRESFTSQPTISAESGYHDKHARRRLSTRFSADFLRSYYAAAYRLFLRTTPREAR